MEDSYKVRVMIWSTKQNIDRWKEDVYNRAYMENFAYVTITGDLHRVQKAVKKVKVMVYGCHRSLFRDYNPDLDQKLMKKIRSLDELKAINQMNQLKLEEKKPTETSDKL